MKFWKSGKNLTFLLSFTTVRQSGFLLFCLSNCETFSQYYCLTSWLFIVLLPQSLFVSQYDSMTVCSNNQKVDFLPISFVCLICLRRIDQAERIAWYQAGKRCLICLSKNSGNQSLSNIGQQSDFLNVANHANRVCV